ncbi:hypothetical protein [Pseudomonas syringae]|uniref:hypothetical protein n=1 Tax=Pseudomonas syringae TaxID=317 RepID=UPI000A21CD64|nr:hypothetical protein [Pseudomonas syringae]AYL16411.1 hypothetical protein D9N00_19210 [Pseudomonas syringae pv. actinidiae]OSR62639.1 hypothetical protein BV325_01677 [Pseudomonas syringae pv. actinidiae]
MFDAHVMEREQHKYRQKIKSRVRGCYLLLLLAVSAPFIGYFDVRPIFETREVWFQRSGALTTAFALLATTTKEVAFNLLHCPGFFGEQRKLDVRAEFDFRFHVIFILGFLITIIGTFIWGYGDTICRLIESPDSLATSFGLDK